MSPNYFICFVVCFFFLGVSCVAYARALVKKNAAMADSINLKAVIHNLPFPWCCWYADEEKVIVSEKFLNLLEINGSHVMGLADIYRLFGQSSLSRFQRALSHLKDYGGDFSLRLTLEHYQDREFAVNGSLVEIKRFGGSFFKKKLSANKLIVLCVQDVTAAVFDFKKQRRESLEIEREAEILRGYVERVPTMLWFKDRQGRIAHCNLAYAEALDTSASRVVAENLELVPKRGGANALSKREGAKIHAVIKGQRRLLEVTETETPAGTIGFANDITAIEEWESELRRHEQSQREILENLSDAIAIYGVDTRLRYFNSAYLKTFRLQEAFLYSRPKFGDVLEDLRKRRKMTEVENFKKHKENRLSLFNTVFEPVHEIHHQPDGSVLKMTVCPHALGGLLFIFEDVSDKLALESGYNTLLAVQKETIDNLHEGLIVVGTDLRLRLSNNSCGKLLRVNDSARAPGTRVAEFLEAIKPLFDARTFDYWNSRVYELCENRLPATEMADILPEGKIQIAYIPLPDGSHLFGFMDVYDRWKSEKSIKDRNEALEYADRLKSDFISNVSYELRAPLNSISGFVDILKNQYFGELNERQRDYCLGIAEASQKLNQLIADMVDLASIETGKLTLNYGDIDLNKFLESCSALVGNRAQDQGVELKVINESTFKEFYGDEKRLKHAVFNLLLNSLKFTLPGGQVNLIASDAADEKNTLAIRVEDTGVGISASDSKKIFEALDSNAMVGGLAKGMGLGLPLVKKLIELHRGKISMVSKENEGTKIICRVPAKKPEFSL